MTGQQMYAVYDKDTKEPIYWEHDQNKVLFVAHKVGRKTVTVGPVDPQDIKNKKPVMVENELFASELAKYLSDGYENNVRESTMNKTTVISLTEMKIENVKEDIIIPNTSNPDLEAKELTTDTGVYHYAVDDDMTGKQAIIRTNVKALTEEEWIRKSFYTPDHDVIEPNNFEKNDEYDVTSTRNVAEGYDRDKWEAGYEAFERGEECPTDPSEKDGWLEAKKEHRKEQMMREGDDVESNWVNKAPGLFKHSYFPLVYDDNSGEVHLYDIDGVNSLDEAEFIGTFGSVEEMDDWIKNNLKDGVEEQYKALAEDETSNIRTADRGVNNNGDNYGPAPEEHQNDLKFDDEGRAIVEAKFKSKSSSFDSYIYLANDDEVEVEVFYDIDEDDPSVGYQGGVVITSVVEKNTGQDLMDSIGPKDANRLFDEATADANAQVDDHSDYEYEKMRDRRMMDESEVEEAIKPEWIFEPGPDDSKKLIFYTTNNHDPHDANIYVGDIILKSVSDLEKYFPREEYGDYKFEMLANDGRRFDGVEEDQFTYDETADDLRTYGSESDNDVNEEIQIDEFANDGGDEWEWYGPFDSKDDARSNAIENISGGVSFDVEEGKNYSIKHKNDGFYWSEYAPGLSLEGKDYRYDPDADDEDWERQERFKQRKQDKKERKKDIDEASYRDIGYQNMIKADQKVEREVEKLRKEQQKRTPEKVNEADRDSDRVYILSVDFNNVRVELENKGMIDIDAAIDIIADGRPKDQFRDEIALGGVPASYELNRDGSTALVVLDTTMRNAIESMCSMDSCQGMLDALDINEDVFFGFLIQGKVGDTLDDSTELEEDEQFDSPEFVVSTENLNDYELAQDPAFIQTMKDAYFQVAEEVGERIEDWDPSMAQIDSVISIGIENYPYAQKYSFLINDSMARDAVNSAFNILWDEGKINSPEEN